MLVSLSHCSHKPDTCLIRFSMLTFKREYWVHSGSDSVWNSRTRREVPIVTGDAQQHDSTVSLHLIPPGAIELITEKEHHSWKLPFAAMPLAVSVQH